MLLEQLAIIKTEVLTIKENNHAEKHHTQDDAPGILSKALLTGFIGGILWSSFGVVMYYFKFSEVEPKTFLLRSWVTAGWTNDWLGDVLSILMAGIVSLLTALLYYALFKKINTMWVGILYGVILWGIIFYILHPLFSHVPKIIDLQWETIVSTICLFILYGGFIGYSISFDYHNKKVMEEH